MRIINCNSASSVIARCTVITRNDWIHFAATAQLSAASSRGQSGLGSQNFGLGLCLGLETIDVINVKKIIIGLNVNKRVYYEKDCKRL